MKGGEADGGDEGEETEEEGEIVFVLYTHVQQTLNTKISTLHLCSELGGEQSG